MQTVSTSVTSLETREMKTSIHSHLVKVGFEFNCNWTSIEKCKVEALPKVNFIEIQR